MKKYLKILILCLTFGIFTTGCLEYNTTIKINNDKSMDFSIFAKIDFNAMSDMLGSMGYDSNDTDYDYEEYLNCLEENDGDESNCLQYSSSTSSPDEIPEIDDEEFTALKNKGYNVDIKQDNQKYEINISKRFNNIDDVSKKEDVVLDLNKITDENFEEKFFKVEKGLLEDKYTLRINTSNTSQDSSLDLNNSDIDLDAFSNLINVSYQIILPEESISNNATKISNDKKTLTWDATSSVKEINVTFALPNKNKNLIIFGGVAVLLIIIVLIIIVLKKSKNKTNNLQVQNQNVNQEQMPQNNVQNQQVVNQNMGINQSLSNGLNTMARTVPESTPNVETPQVNMESTQINEPALEPTPNVMTPQVSMEQTQINEPVPEPTPNVENPQVSTEATSSSMPVNNDEANKINSDLQNVALNILNQNNDSK